MYKRTDQKTLYNCGLGHKSELSVESGGLKSAHGLSMLQRFRQGRDLREYDKYKPKPEDHEDPNEIRGKENEWWRTNVITEE